MNDDHNQNINNIINTLIKIKQRLNNLEYEYNLLKIENLFYKLKLKKFYKITDRDLNFQNIIQSIRFINSVNKNGEKKKYLYK